MTPSPEAASAATERHHGIWWTRRALLLHLTIAILVPGFTALFLWQVTRALSGNELSWAYVFEWPFFGGYAVYMWWRLVHEPPEAEPAPLSAEAAAKATTPAPSPEAQPRPSDEETSHAAASGSQVAEPAPAGFYARWQQRREAAHEEQARREAAELAAYNRYLAELHATGERRN